MKFNGLPTILKKKGYTNYFYITGKKSFDNMNSFLLPNGFDRVIGESDYPSEAIETSWGVSDKTMFNRIIDECDSLYSIAEKFFINALTISTHEANYVPDWCKHHFYHTEYPQKLYEFMDLQIKEFFEKAKSKKWFDNTVFVIFGDHGQNFSPTYDMSLNYHRIPLIIYAPKIIKHKTYKKFGIQSDIYPTICGLLDFTYKNNALGIDLTKENREFAYFSADTKIGVINNDYFMIYRNDNNISLYEYKKNSTDIYQSKKAIADSMCRYTFSMLQSSQYIIKKQLAE
jgi:phosphoglycerol transferase MdoB-like AlkP superfamily enzyme